MANIKLMDTILSNKIAAGEVVEKCVSVVKELVENSIDAGSTIIKVYLLESGTKQIKVVDNGIGMDKEDAVICFERHATSKLLSEDDLYNINTLGFRGEALPSIASVSKVKLITCKDDIGTSVIIEGGILKEVKNNPSINGTSIEINDLFYNMPARLKHMKSLYTELANITDFISKIALSYPGIKFVLSNNNSEIINTDGSNNLLKTISSVYGINTAKSMLYVTNENDDYSINGYISKPEVHKSNRNSIVILVNGRVVRNSELNKVINDSYGNYKPDNRYPVIVLNIDVEPSLIDVNIHPTKMDIKFSKMDELNLLISKTIKNKLNEINLIPEVNFDIEEKYNYMDSVYSYTKKEENLPKSNIQNNYKDVIVSNYSVREEIKKPTYVEQTLNLEREVTTEKKELSKNHLPELYPVGAVLGTYIVCQNEDGMYLIDQHAAKERINYEIVLNNLLNIKDTKVHSLVPITVELSNSDFILYKDKKDILNEINFDTDEFGVTSIIIKSVPLWITRFNEGAIKKVIELVLQDRGEFDKEKFSKNLAATLACKMSIKANTRITLEEMEFLVDDLRKCENPYNCPHGRPVIINFTKYDIEKLFKRSGF